MASKQEVIALDAERKSRRERFSQRVGNAREKLAPSRLAAKIGDEQKAKLRDAGKRAETFTRDHKYAIGGGLAAVAAGVAGLLVWKRKTDKTALKTQNDESIPTKAKVDKALEDTKPITDVQGAPAAGAVG